MQITEDTLSRFFFTYVTYNMLNLSLRWSSSQLWTSLLRIDRPSPHPFIDVSHAPGLTILSRLRVQRGVPAMNANNPLKKRPGTFPLAPEHGSRTDGQLDTLESFFIPNFQIRHVHVFNQEQAEDTHRACELTNRLTRPSRVAGHLNGYEQSN